MTTLAQLMPGNWPSPKNREATPLAEFAVALPKGVAPLGATAAKYDDFSVALLLEQTAPDGSLARRAVFGADAPPRFWSMTQAERRTAAFLRILPQLKQIFAEAGVPEYFVWLAEIESAFDPQASSSKGAVGLFQLTEETAERFGLRLAPVDERKLPEKNARAAAQYLRQLHDRFGCWALALAAYNAGEKRLERIMQKCPTASFDDLSPFLPEETRLYVPRALALLSSREGVGAVAVR